MNIRTVSFNGFTFVDVHNPQEFELKFLKHNYNFDQIHLDDFTQKQQITKIEIEKNYILVSLDFPHLEKPGETKKINGSNGNGHQHEKKHHTFTYALSTTPVSIPLLISQSKKKRIRTGHVAFFIKEKYLVILHDERTPQIDEVFAECQQTLKKREEFMGLGPQYLFYRIADILVDSSLQVINDITSTIDKIDKHVIEDNPAEKIVEDISATRRNIVVFQTMVKPSMNIFSDLEHHKYPQMDVSLTSSWSNIKDHLQRIWYRLEDSKELIEGIATSYESLLTAKTNEIVKVLTMFTAILLPLTLLASIYGMNIVGLPHADKPYVLTSLVLIMLIMAIGMVIVFKLKKWL